VSQSFRLSCSNRLGLNRQLIGPQHRYVLGRARTDGSDPATSQMLAGSLGNVRHGNAWRRTPTACGPDPAWCCHGRSWARARKRGSQPFDLAMCAEAHKVRLTNARSGIGSVRLGSRKARHDILRQRLSPRLRATVGRDRGVIEGVAVAVMLIARFDCDTDRLRQAYDRAHALIMSRGGATRMGELRHHCAIGEGAFT
jgi:hypothetical protein